MLVDDDDARASETASAFARGCVVKVEHSLGAALAALERGLRPDVIFADLAHPENVDILEALDRAADGAAVIVVASGEDAACERGLFVEPGPAGAREQVDRLLEARKVWGAAIAAARRDLKAEIVRAGEEAARRAPDKALDRLLERAGAHDLSEVRHALEIARAAETFRNRFWSAISQGIATFALLAMGAGLIALIKRGLIL